MKEIELVGLYPAAMSPCHVCDLSDLGAKLAAEQAGEAAKAAVDDSARVRRIAEVVFARHGQDVRIRLTPADSPRGLWLSLRHRLGGGLQALVDGRKVPPEPQRVLEALG